MRAIHLVLVAAVALAACQSSAAPAPQSVDVIRGRIEGLQRPDKASVVQVYRLDEKGLPTPDPFETASLDKDGKFTTGVLSPGRYRLMYRIPDGPPSELTVHVPSDNMAVLRPLVLQGLVQLRVISAGGQSLRCRLTEAAGPEGIPDLREFSTHGDSPVFVRGLRPGRWYLDVPELGATTEVDVPKGEPMRDLVVDPPPVAAGSAVYGEIRRMDGVPAAWLVVTARPLQESGEAAGRWGRYASTDRAGEYRIVGIPPGKALVRVECREVPMRVLPVPMAAAIPPSGALHLGFVVEP
jgi:hypothetical protein